jgi:hypothetical protein
LAVSTIASPEWVNKNGVWNLGAAQPDFKRAGRCRAAQSRARQKVYKYLFLLIF